MSAVPYVKQPFIMWECAGRQHINMEIMLQFRIHMRSGGSGERWGRKGTGRAEEKERTMNDIEDEEIYQMRRRTYVCVCVCVERRKIFKIYLCRAGRDGVTCGQLMIS